MFIETEEHIEGNKISISEIVLLGTFDIKVCEMLKVSQ